MCDKIGISKVVEYTCGTQAAKAAAICETAHGDWSLGDSRSHYYLQEVDEP